MLQFFRRLRQGFLFKGQASRYLIYAFGEILLVMIGILLALQVNNWNEERKERKKEGQVLLSLAEDFEANNAALNRSIIRIENRIEQIKTVLSYAGLKEDQLTSAMKDTIRNTGYILTNIIEGTVSSLLSSDKLEIIKNDALKKLLTAYPAHVKLFKDIEASIKSYVLQEQRSIHRKYISLAEFFSDKDPKIRRYKTQAFQSDFESLLEDKTYLNVTTGILMTQNGLLQSANQLKDKTDEIYKLIRKELE